MSKGEKQPLRVAFVVREFPATTETFIVDQVADLLDRGVDVQVFAFERGDVSLASERFEAYRLSDRVHFLEGPERGADRLRESIPMMFRMLWISPAALLRSLNFVRYGRQAWSLRLLHMVAPFVLSRFDVVHCHYGTVANRFLRLRDVSGVVVPLVTTFYGFDASRTFRDRPSDFYDRLKKEGSLFLTMSNDMKARLVAHGFPEDRIEVHPVSINLEDYPFTERRCDPGSPVELLFVGRFVEKKGCDDLVRALAIARARVSRPLRCTLVGGGPMEQEIRGLVAGLGLADIVDFRGYMRMGAIIDLFPHMHILVQPSRTARDGDME